MGLLTLVKHSLSLFRIFWNKNRMRIRYKQKIYTVLFALNVPERSNNRNNDFLWENETKVIKIMLFVRILFECFRLVKGLTLLLICSPP